MKKILPKSLLLLCLSLVATVSVAEDQVSINNLNSVITITLTPQEMNTGTIESSDIDFCVIAYNDDNNNRNNFKFKIEQSRGANNEFRLYNGSSTIPLTVRIGSYYDKDNNVVGLDNLQEVSPNQSTQKQYKGGRSCSDDNYGKSRLKFSFSTSLQTLSAGTYEANLVMNANAGNKKAELPFTIRVIVPSVVQITRLNDISLRDMGVFGYAGSSSFCVYSSTGSFLIKAEGPSADNNNFLLHNGSATLPYTVNLNRNDSLGAPQTVTPGQKVNINATPADCQSEDNSNVSVAVVRDAVASAQAGTYTGTLYLTVEPN